MRKLVVDDGGFARWAGGTARQVRRRRLGRAAGGSWPEARKLNWLPEVGLHLMGRVTWPRSTIAHGDLTGEYRLVVQPVVLGGGLPLFAGLAAPFSLDLIEARSYADGSVLHTYR
jgi:hypothetical protein